VKIADMIENDKKDSKWIEDQFKAGLLKVDESFQRRYVWLKKHKIKLIETILIGYTIPEIYLWAIDTNSQTGETTYSIVDGQQRIGALTDYIGGKFTLTGNYLEDSQANFANKKFNELSDEDRKNIWSYRFSIRFINEEVSYEDIVKMFLRLNSTDKALNPQELRHAEFDGLFLKTATEVADFPFWGENNIFSSDELRRMGDVQFTSSILMFLRLGVESENSQDAINKAYDLFNEKYDEADSDKKMIQKMLDYVQELVNKKKKILPFIKKSTHLYALLIMFYKAIMINKKFEDLNITSLIDFIMNYLNESGTESLYNEYKELSSQGTQKKSNRLRRISILSQIAGIA
jgi:hypothetical protein